MKNILLIKASNIDDVRLQKYIKVLSDKNYNLTFIGWERKKRVENDIGIEVKYLLTGFNSSKFQLLFGYVFWIFCVFFYLLFNYKKYKIIYSVDFESTFSVYVISKFFKIQYIYDIYDEFAIRYNFPSLIKKILQKLDFKIRDKSYRTVHVDKNRVSQNDTNYMIIENSPFDFYNGNFMTPKFEKVIAVTGLMSSSRGIKEIYDFALDYSSIKFILIGEFPGYEETLKHQLQKLDNVDLFLKMSQYEVFEKIKNCSAIMALYDPKIEINRKAASNKLYDGMMLGIPVISNEGIEMSNFIKEKNIGLVINYTYNKYEWQKIENLINSPESLSVISKKSRDLYEKNFNFEMKVLELFNEI